MVNKVKDVCIREEKMLPEKIFRRIWMTGIEIINCPEIKYATLSTGIEQAPSISEDYCVEG